ncbi:MAG: threonine/serine exporter family protein [Eubacteriales bacterium]|nr:threonine/serine exporter family protein [Eubacteriales bacterium]
MDGYLKVEKGSEVSLSDNAVAVGAVLSDKASEVKATLSYKDAAVEAVVLATLTILESSGETYRAEDTALRMACALGFDKAEILAFPTGFVLTLTLKNGEIISTTKRIAERSLRLDRINEVNSVSRAVVSKELDAFKALARLKELRESKSLGNIKKAFIFAICAASFTLMFGGGVKEFFISFAAGFAVQTSMPVYSYLKAPSLIVSLFSGVLAAGITMALIGLFGGNREPIIAGSIMPMLPGVAMTNAVRDTMRGDLISGTARGTDAFLNALLIAVGVSLVLAI